MAKRGRRPVLDTTKKKEILAILSVGCSRRTAANYVGCAVSTIHNTADRDPEFADALRHAEYQSEIAYLKNIQKAARKEQYWRAAAWALERKNPAEYAARSPDVITVDQIKLVLAELTEIVVSEVPIPLYRKRILKRFDALGAVLRRSAKKESADDEV
ncbi:MAG: hypothetical protein ABIK89_06095 [Planctomycetota bacterium]